MKDISEKLY